MVLIGACGDDIGAARSDQDHTSGYYTWERCWLDWAIAQFRSHIRPESCNVDWTQPPTGFQTRTKLRWTFFTSILPGEANPMNYPNHRLPLSDRDVSAVTALSMEYRMQGQILREQSQTLRDMSRALCDQARAARRRLEQLRARRPATPGRGE
jgi:hypothetical protein